MEYLRTLRIWLDRDTWWYWSKLDERAVISPLQPLSHKPGLDVCLELPRHYDDNITVLPFRMQRRLRQRYFKHYDRRGYLEVLHMADFPVLQYGPDGQLAFYGLGPYSAEEEEDVERRIWRSGLDVDLEFNYDGRYHPLEWI